MRGGPTFDQEKVSFNLARLKKFGENFEVVVDPDLAVKSKEGEAVPLEEIVKAQKIFADAKKGLLASEEHMQTAFGTTDTLQVAKVILADGEIQLTAEHRARIREEKTRRVLDHIRRNAIDPKSGLPHPLKRIELAFEQGKIKVDETRSIDDQVKEIVQKLQVILPIRFAQAVFRIQLGGELAQKNYGDIKAFGKMKSDEWLSDGSWVCTLEIPAGMQNELLDMLAQKTQGAAQVEKIKET